MVEGSVCRVNDLRCWHVHYRFCGVSAEITVYANDERKHARRQWINFAGAA
jgi:hypothetical protein